MGLSPRVDERRCGLSERHDYCLRKEMKRKVERNAVCDCGKDECKGPRNTNGEQAAAVEEASERS